MCPTQTDRHALNFLHTEPEALGMLKSFTTPRASVQERMAAGKALRMKLPRRAQGEFTPHPDRLDPVTILERQNATRVKKLVPVRMARMLTSSFSFLRGTAAIMAADLAQTADTGMRVSACGDMHVSNFGVFASAERSLVFAINDFDETHPGPWEWDIKRLVTSAVVAAGFLGGDRHDGEDAARAVVSSYRQHMRNFASMGHLEIWYYRIDEQAILASLPAAIHKNAIRVMNRAKRKGHIRLLEKMTEQVDGVHRIREALPLIARETTTENGTPIDEALDAMLRSYIGSLSVDRQRLLSRYRIVDVARKVVGVGSVGTGCWVVLLKGVDGDDPLFLQVKQAQESVLAPYSDMKLPFTHQGQRVVMGQRLIQGSPDIFLGWGDAIGGQFYVRQLADMKGSVIFEPGKRAQLGVFKEYCRLCGWALALAHAKSGDPARIAGYCGTSDVLDDALTRFAQSYAAQNDRDYAGLEQARRSGRIQVAEG